MPAINITTGDEFAYYPWNGNSLAFFAEGVLVVNRIGTSDDGAMTWKCKDAADTKKLLEGETVMVEWDNNTDHLVAANAVNNNAIRVMHGDRPFYFNRTKPKPIMSVASGSQFNYDLWGGKCRAFFIKAGCLNVTVYNEESNADGLKTWRTKSPKDTDKLFNGEDVTVEWGNRHNMKYHRMTALDNDTFRVMHGDKPYYFQRVPMMTISTGDKFSYDPWGGDCLAFFADGVLVVNRIGTSDDGAMTWKCKDAADTKRLLAGEDVIIDWEDRGLQLKMTATDNDTFRVMHGRNAFYFKRV